MSDEQQPPRKVGSLRDRIAQFDQKPAAPPPTAPKPAVAQKKWAWKEKQAEVQAHPPPPPAASASSSTLSPPPAAAADRDSWSDVSSHHDVPEKSAPAPAPAFSAADAASSIAAGGGLKARLAALQGSGFGSTPEASPVPPPPSGKPRVWKKVVVPYEAPPKPERPRPAEDETAEAEAEEEHHHDAPEAEAHPVAAEGEADADATDEPKDPEEEERQRRAAIAARMARLGGARVGMGMPVFGKPPVPPPIRKDSGTDTETPAAPAAPVAPARQASASPPVPRKEPSIEEPSESVRDSVAETEMTYEEETTTEATESKEDLSYHEILPTPASPPRPRPPVPATRAWSNSPPASPKMRPAVISQGSSFSVPRSVYEYPSNIYPIVARASGGIAVADHLRNNRSPSPIMSSPLSLSPVSGSPTSYESAEHPHPARRQTAGIPRQERPLSQRHSDSALRSSMISDSGPSVYSSNRVTRFYEPQGFFGPSLFVSNQMATGQNSHTLNHSQFASSPSHSRAPPSNPPRASKPAPDTEDLNSVVHEPLYRQSDEHKPVSHSLSRSGSSSSFYPRPLTRSATPPNPHAHKHNPASIHSSSNSSTRIRFKLLGWLSKKRRLTESSLPAPHDTASINSGSSMTPAARIKSKYQLASAAADGSDTQPSGSSSTHRRMPTAPEPIQYPTYGAAGVVSVNSPVNEFPPAPPPKSDSKTTKSKIPPPRPPRPGSPASTRSNNTSDSDAASTSSRPRRLQRQNVLRTSPAFSTRKPSFGNDGVGSDAGSVLTRSGSMRSNTSGSAQMAQIHTLLPPNHQPASTTLKHAREDGAAVEEVEGGGDRKGYGEGREEEDSGEGHQKGLTEGKEGDEKEAELGQKKPSHDAPVPTALSLALQIDKQEPTLEVSTSPPSIPTSARPTSASPASASSGKALPPMPKRALPPRRKMPTPKVSSEAVPSVTSPPVPEVSSHPEHEKPAEEGEPKPEGVEKVAAEVKAATPPSEAVADVSPAEAEQAVPGHAETVHGKEDSSKEVEREVLSSPRGGARVSEALEASGNEEKKVDDEKRVENVKPIEKATGGEFGGPALPSKSSDSKKGKRRASQQSTSSRSGSMSGPQPRGLHEASPRASSERQRQQEPSSTLAESSQPFAVEDEALKESDRKQQLAQRMAKLGG
ncbi:hypothetical protein FRC01_009776, partial [Tulasnella sp. 417]